jgi:hypothetical protein
MIAYNKTWLDNAIVQEEVKQAFRRECITQEEKAHIEAAYPVGFYTPNVYIRAGLLLLTAFIVFLSFCLLMMIFDIDRQWRTLTTFLAVLVYCALELLVMVTKHYRSGVDQGLLWASFGLLSVVITSLSGASTWQEYLLISVIAFYATLRFADMLMAAVAILALLASILYACASMEDTGRLIAPLLIMSVSILLYQLARRLGKLERWRHYAHCCAFAEITTLITLYLAGNYLAVEELGYDIFYSSSLEPAQSVPVGWLIWVCTAIIPLIYVYSGLLKKDVILLRIGMLTTAASIYTVLHYYSVMPPETVMTLSGIILIIGSWAVIRYLRIPKHGFTSQAEDTTDLLENLPVASIVLSEVQPHSAATQQGTGVKFGGGTGGGGGADGSW